MPFQSRSLRRPKRSPQPRRKQQRRLLSESLENRQLLAATPLDAAARDELRAGLAALQDHADRVDSLPPLQSELAGLGQTFQSGLDVSDVLGQRLVIPLGDFLQDAVSTDQIRDFLATSEDISGTAGLLRFTATEVGLNEPVDSAGEFSFDTTLYATQRVVYDIDLGQPGDELGLRLDDGVTGEAEFSFAYQVRFGLDGDGEFFSEIDSLRLSISDGPAILAGANPPNVADLDEAIGFSILLDDSVSVPVRLPAQTSGNLTPLVQRLNNAIAQPLADAGVPGGVRFDVFEGSLRLRAVAPEIQSLQIFDANNLSQLGFTDSQRDGQTFAPGMTYGMVGLTPEDGGLTIHASVQTHTEPGPDQRLSIDELISDDGPASITTQSVGGAALAIDVVAQASDIPGTVTSRISGEVSNPFHGNPWSLTTENFETIDAIQNQSVVALEQGLQSLGEFVSRLELEPEWRTPLPALATSLADVIDSQATVQTKILSPLESLFAADPLSNWRDVQNRLADVVGIDVESATESPEALELSLLVRDAATTDARLAVGDDLTDAGLTVAAEQLPTVPLTVDTVLPITIVLRRDAQADPLDAVSLAFGQLGHTAMVDTSSLEFQAKFGFAEVAATGGAVTISAGLATTVNGDLVSGTNRSPALTAAELSEATLGDLTGTSTSGSFAAGFDLDAAIGGQSVSGRIGLDGDPVPGESAPMQAIAIDDLLPLTRVSAAELAGGLAQMGQWFADFATERLNQSFPLADATQILDVIDFASAFEAALVDPLKDDQGQLQFDSLQSFETLLERVSGASFDGTLGSEELTFTIDLSQLDLPTIVAALDLDLEVGNFAGLDAEASISLLPSILGTFRLGLDLRNDAELEFSDRLFVEEIGGQPIATGQVQIINDHFDATGNLGFTEVTIDGAGFEPSVFTASVSLPQSRMTLSDLLRGLTSASTSGVDAVEATLEGLIQFRLPTLASVMGDDGQSDDYSADLVATLSDFGGDLVASVDGTIDAVLEQISRLDADDILNGVLDGLSELFDFEDLSVPFLDVQLPDAAGLKALLDRVETAVDSIGSSTLDVIRSAFNRMAESSEGETTRYDFPDLSISLTGLFGFYHDASDLLSGLGDGDTFSLQSLESLFVEHFSFDIELPDASDTRVSKEAFSNFVREVLDIADVLQLTGAGSLQALEQVLENAIGLGSDGVTIALTTGAGGATEVRLDLLLDQTLEATYPLQVDLSDLGVGGVGDLLDVGGSASVSLTAGALARLSLGLEIPSGDGESIRPFLYTNAGGTQLSLTAGAVADDIDFEASLGPLGVEIVDGMAAINRTGAVGDTDPAMFTISLVDLNGDGRYEFSENLDFTVDALGGAFASLPIEFPVGGPFVVDLSIDANDLASGDLTDSNFDELGPYLQDRINDLGNIGDNLLALVGGWEGAFDLLIDVMRGDVLGVPLPLIGDALSDEADFLQDIKDSVLDNIEDVAQQGVSLVQTGIFDALGPGGLNWLLDATGDSLVTVDDVIANVDSTGNRVDFDLKLGKPRQTLELPVEFDLGLPGLNFDLDAPVDLDFGFEFDLGFGVGIDEGFYLDVADTGILIDFEASVEELAASGELAFLDVDATSGIDPDTGMPETRFGGRFEVDLVDPGADGMLTLSEMLSASASDLIDTTFSADADIQLQVVASIQGSDYLPRLRTDLVVDWDFVAGQDVNQPSVNFENVQINLGDFFSGFAGDVLGAVQDVLEPVQPMIDVLTQRIPVISDLAGSTTTLVDLARTFGRADVADFLASIIEVNDLITGLPTDLGPDSWVDLGQFSVNADALGGYTGPGWSASQMQSELRLTDVVEASDPLGQAASQSGPRGAQWTNNLAGAKGSLSFPLLQNPATAFGLLLGKDVDLFLYDAPALGIDFAYRQSFPTPIPGLFAELGGRIAAVADFAFGFDTSGIRQFNQTGNFVDVFNGFFVSDRAGADGTGADVPEAYLRGSLTAGGNVDVLIAAAGVRGGIFADVDFNLNDPDRDGRVRAGEIARNAALGPIHIFDVDGKVDAGVSGFYRFLFFEDEFEIARVNLLDFEIARPISGGPSPTDILTSRAGDVLTLNFTQQDDNYRILPGSRPDSIVVQGRGMITQDIVGVESIAGNMLGGNDTFTVSRDVLLPIEIDGGAGNDQMTAGSGPVRFFGGAGDDSLTGGDDDDFLDGGAGDDDLFGSKGADELLGGDGEDYLEGNDDNDRLIGGSGDDRLIGGSGNDEIDGNAGDDHMDGDRGADLIRGGDGHDRIDGGLGDDRIFGGAGDDILFGDEGADVIDGDAGDDEIHGGQRNDVLRGGDGNDQVDGDSGNDSIHGNDGDDQLLGGVGADSIHGGNGDDQIFADSDPVGDENAFAHTLTGGAGDDTIVGSRGKDTIDAGDGNDTVTALAGDDVVVGGLGDDNLFGGAGRDLTWGGLAGLSAGQFDAANIDLFEMPPEFAESTTRMAQSLDALNDLNGTSWSLDAGVALSPITPKAVAGRSLGGTLDDGEDEIRGGDGDDWLFGGGQVDVLFGGSGNDYLDGGAGNETTLFGDEGDDVIRGGDGDDVIRGGAGIDQIYGDAGRDVLYGDAGDVSGSTVGQRLHGGDGIDTLYAYAAGDATDVNAFGEGLFGGGGGDFLYGNLRGDLIFGDDGSDLMVGDWAAGADYRRNDQADTTGGNDAMSGSAGQDQAYGGGGNDVLLGGADGDWLEGQDGNDRSIGGAGIDFLIADVRAGYADSGGDQFDGHGDPFVDDDFATDVLWIGGTTDDDVISIAGGPDGQLHLSYNGVDLQLAWTREDEFLVEQIRVDGMTGDDVISIDPNLDLSALSQRSRDFVTILEGGPGDDELRGSSARDRIDGGRGSDLIWGNAGDDRLWGDQGENDGSASDHDVIYAGGGSDDVLGGQGTNALYAWSSDPAATADKPFGVFVDVDGERQLEDTGLNRIIGGPLDDLLFGGTGLDLLFGGDGENTLFTRTGETFESLDGGSGDDAWKQYARSTGQVWYVGGSNVDDQINVDFVTEPGILQGHHLITRLTKTTSDTGEEFFTFDAQVRLDFAATDDDGNLVWDTNRAFADGDLLASDDPFERAEALNNRRSDGAFLNQVLPPEDDFRAIIIDALAGDDEILVGPTVQKTVWVDAGDGDDVVRFASGRPILIDQTDALNARNDSAENAFALPGPPVLIGDSVDPADIVLEDDARFFLIVDDLSERVEIVLRAADTDGTAPGSVANTSLDDLVEDLNFAIENSAANRRVVARRIGDAISLSGTRISEISRLRIDAQPQDAAVTHLNLPAAATSESTPDLRRGVRYTGLTIDNPADVDFYRFRTPESAIVAVEARSLAVSDGVVASLVAEETVDGFTQYVVEVSTNSIPTVYELAISIDGEIPALVVDLSDEFDFARRDVIFGGAGNDVLQGGPGEDFIFGGSGNDVLTGGDDTGASDLLFGNDGEDLFQTVPSKLPVLLGTTTTFIPTQSDRFAGGDGNDQVVYLGTNEDDLVSMRSNRLLDRYEVSDLAYDTANGSFTPIRRYHYFTSVSIEAMVVDLLAGDDDFRGDENFRFPADEETWGFAQGDWQVSSGSLLPLTVIGGDGDDRLFGTPINDTLIGGDGDDFISGGFGNDVIDGGNGDDFLVGDTSVGAGLPLRDVQINGSPALELPPLLAGTVIDGLALDEFGGSQYLLRPINEFGFGGQFNPRDVEQRLRLFTTIDGQRVDLEDWELFVSPVFNIGTNEDPEWVVASEFDTDTGEAFVIRAFPISGSFEGSFGIELTSASLPSVDVSVDRLVENRHGFQRRTIDLGQGAIGRGIVLPAGDFDGDGFEDFILSASDLRGEFYAYLYYGGSDLLDPEASFQASRPMTRIAIPGDLIDVSAADQLLQNQSTIRPAGDWNRDGIGDLLVSTETDGLGQLTLVYGSAGREADVSTLPGAFTEGRVVELVTTLLDSGRYAEDPSFFYADGIGDIRGNQRDTFASVDGQYLHIVSDNAIDSFEVDARRVAGLGDINGDGFVDFAAINSDELHLGFGNASGVITEPMTIPAPFPGAFRQAEIIDAWDESLDAESSQQIADFVISGQTETTANNLALGSGLSFLVRVTQEPGGAPVVTFTEVSVPYLQPIGDFSGDGKMDFAATVNETVELSDPNLAGSEFVAPRTHVWFSENIADLGGRLQVDPGFAHLVLHTSDAPINDFPTQRSRIVTTPDFGFVGDLDGDGQSDLAIFSRDRARLSVVFGGPLQDLADGGSSGDLLPLEIANHPLLDTTWTPMLGFDGINAQAGVEPFPSDDTGPKMTSLADAIRITGGNQSFSIDGARAVGDINADGHMDFVATTALNEFVANSEAEFLVFGPFSETGVVSIDQLSNIAFYGDQASITNVLDFRPGRPAKDYGDVDSDGIDDLVLVQSFCDGEDVCRIQRRVFAGGDDLPARLASDVDDVSNQFTFRTTGQSFWKSELSFIDWDGGGTDWLLVSGNFADADQGRIAAISYTPGGDTAVNLTLDFDSVSLVPPAGMSVNRDASFLASSIGDIDGDGKEDLAIAATDLYRGSTFDDVAGQVFVVLGRSVDFGTVTEIELTDLASPTLIILGGVDSVAALGDNNHDGYDEFAIGRAVEGGGDLRGSVLIYQGGLTWRQATPSIVQPWVTVSQGDLAEPLLLKHLGSLSYATGDLNADGRTDLVVGLPTVVASIFGGSSFEFDEVGKAYLFDDYLSGTDLPSANVLSLGEADRVFTGTRTRDRLGSMESSRLHDFNADGIDDLWIGASGAPGTAREIADPGRVYFLLGQIDAFEVPESFEILANRGSRLVDPQTGRTSTFTGDDFVLDIDQQEAWFRFTTSGDGDGTLIASDFIRVEGLDGSSTLTLDLLDQKGQLLAARRTRVDLRNAKAGTYYLRVARNSDVAGAELPFLIEVDAPTLGHSHAPEDRDRLLGGDGTDVIQGGPGSDILRGQAGQDRLIVESSFEAHEFRVFPGSQESDSLTIRSEVSLVTLRDPVVDIPAEVSTPIRLAIADALGHPVTFDTNGDLILHRPWLASELAQVEYLDLSGMTLPDTNGFELLPSLRHLNLSNTRLNRVGPNLPPNLRMLDLSENPISSIDSVLLAGLPKLEVLLLNDTQVTDLGPLVGVSIVDDAVRNGLASRSGVWTHQDSATIDSATNGAFAGGYHVSKTGGRSFYFLNVVPGEEVEIFVTWPEGLIREQTEVRYQIFQTESDATVLVDQSFAPDGRGTGGESFGRTWQSLGTYVPTASQVIVTIQGPDGQTVLADAVYTRKTETPTWPLKQLSINGVALDANSRDFFVRDLQIANPELTVELTENESAPQIVPIADQTTRTGSLSFDDDVATLPPTVLDEATSFLVEFWFQGIEQVGIFDTILSAGGATAALQDEFLIAIDDAQTLRIQNHNSIGETFSSPELDLFDGDWHHIAVARDTTGSSGSMRVYVDGVLLGVQFLNDARPLSVEHIALGQDMDTPGGDYRSDESIRGRLDEVVFWNRYWDNTQDNIDQQILSKIAGRQRGPRPIEPEMNAMFSFEELAGDELTDSTGNHAPGMLGDLDGSGDDVRPAPTRVGSQSIDLSLEGGQFLGGQWLDADGNPVTFTAISDNPNLTPEIIGNRLLLNGNSSQIATAEITVIASDGVGRESRTVFNWNNDVPMLRTRSGQVSITPFLSGNVVRDADGNPIAGASLVLRNILGEIIACSVTDFDGRYAASDLDDIVHSVEVHAPGDTSTDPESWIVADGFDFRYDFESGTLPDLDENGIDDLNPIGDITIGNGVMTIRPNGVLGANVDTQTIWPQLAPTRATGWTVDLRLKIIETGSAEGGRGSIAFAASPEGSVENALLFIGRNDVRWGSGAAFRSILNTDPDTGDPIPVDNTDGFHDFRVIQIPGTATYWVWRDGVLLNDGQPLSNGLSFQSKARFILGAREFSNVVGVTEIESLRINRGLPFGEAGTVVDRDVTVIRNLDVGANRIIELGTTQSLASVSDRNLTGQQWIISDDSGEIARVNGTTANFTPDAAGTYVVQSIAEDADTGDSYADSFRLRVVEPAMVPIIATVPPMDGYREGTAVNFTADLSRFQNPQDWTTLEWLAINEFGQVVASEIVDTGDLDWSFTPDDEGEYEVRLSSTDGTETIAATPVQIQVINVAPSVSADLRTVDLETSSFEIMGSIFDPGEDVALVDVDFGDGTRRPVPMRSDKTFSLGHRYQNEGTYEIVLVVNDRDGDEIQQTLRVDVDPFAPTEILLSQDIDENLPTASGPAFAANLQVVDASRDDFHTFELLDGFGDDDLFAIEGDRLLVGQGVEVDFETRSEYAIRVRVTDRVGNELEQDITIQVRNLPEIASTTIGDGSPQRSRIRGVEVAFDQVVDVEMDAIEVIDANGDVVAATLEMDDASGNTIARLTFTGPRIADGDYRLVVKGDRISAVGAPLGDDVHADFFQKYGDTDGNGSVDLLDFADFRSSFGTREGDPGFSDSLDFNEDQAIDLIDFAAFRNT
ncbi:MAG: LamG-like jellyroll fold domain-containing protein, partial [Planctomycetota bacterium]